MAQDVRGYALVNACQLEFLPHSGAQGDGSQRGIMAIEQEAVVLDA